MLNSENEKFQAFILVGGRSRRMGQDKARLVYGGESVLERISAALSSITPSITLVGAEGRRYGTRFRAIADRYEERGALGGIHAALKDSRTSWIAVVSCDLPFVTGRLFRRLAEFAEDPVEAVAPIQQDGQLQPLCSLLQRDVSLRVAERSLETGNNSARNLLEQLFIRPVAPGEMVGVGEPSLLLMNVNTPEDYLKAVHAADTIDYRDSVLTGLANHRIVGDHAP